MDYKLAKAIRDAVEKGGYKTTLTLLELNTGAGKHFALLDRTFWQALGKARGWRDEEDSCESSSCQHCHGYMMKWHRFIDHLAEGKDAESFFATL